MTEIVDALMLILAELRALRRALRDHTAAVTAGNAAPAGREVKLTYEVDPP